MRARIVVASLVGAVVLPAGLASAAGLSGLSADDLGANRADVASCGTVASYAPDPYVVSGAGTVTAVKVSVTPVTAAGCAGARIDVSLVNASPSGTVVGTGSQTTVSVASCPLASGVNVCTISIASAPGLDVVKALQILTTKP